MIVVLLVVVLVVANQPEPVSAEVYEDMPAEWVGRRVLGNPDAPVVLQAWEDFLCPACSQWNRTVKPQLMENYIAQEGGVAGGQVRLEFHHFPLSGHEPGTSLAAQASECAADQGMFWAYHDRLFAATNEGQPAFTIERLTRYADDLGLDTNQFSQCLINQEYFDEVRGSASEAIALGLNSTPSVIVNGQLMENPFDYQALTAEIRRLIEAAEQ